VGDFCLCKMEKQDLSQKFEDAVNLLGYLLIDFIVRGDSNLKIIELYVDNEVGINSDDCSLIAREINNLIETKKLIDSNYRLVVSSPGVDRPLKYLVQYKKHLNRKFELEYIKNNQVMNFSGRLTGIVDDRLFFRDKKNEIEIKFENIKKAKVLISF